MPLCLHPFGSGWNPVWPSPPALEPSSPSLVAEKQPTPHTSRPLASILNASPRAPRWNCFSSMLRRATRKRITRKLSTCRNDLAPNGFALPPWLAPPATFLAKPLTHGRTHCHRRHHCNRAPWHYVSRRVGQQTPRPRPYLRQNAQALHSADRRGSRENGNEIGRAS